MSHELIDQLKETIEALVTFERCYHCHYDRDRLALIFIQKVNSGSIVPRSMQVSYVIILYSN